jgi:hypothetical protein
LSLIGSAALQAVVVLALSPVVVVVERESFLQR